MRKIILVLVSLSSICFFALAENETQMPLVPPPYPMISMPKATTADQALNAIVKRHLSSQFIGFRQGQNLVVSQGGVISLHGKVNSQQQVEEIISTAEKIKGVTHVNNNLIVSGDREDQ